MGIWFLSIVLILIVEGFRFSKEESLSNSCGTIWYDTPSILYRNVSLHFEPVNFDSNMIVRWTYLVSNIWNNITSDSPHKVSNFSLLVNTLNYTHRDFRVHYGECQSHSIRLELEELKDCGKFYERTTNVRPGETVELGYFPTLAIVNNPDRYVRKFRVINKTCSGCVISNTTGVYEFKELANFEYVLSINSLSDNVTGIYSVQCTSDRKSNKYTKALSVALPVKPNDPILLDTRTVENCDQCLSGVASANTTIRCNVSGGTEPVHVQVLIDGVKETTIKSHDGVFMATVIVTNEMHLKDVRCEAVNHAIFYPVVAHTTIYVEVTPSDPVLTINNTKVDDEIARAYCRIDRARPSPNVTWTVQYVSDVGYSSTSTRNVDNTSTTTAELRITDRDWNGRMLQCCVDYVTYTDPVCKERQLNVSFPPESLNLYHKQNWTEILSSYLYRIHCAISKSYPKCTPDFNLPSATGQAISTREQSTGEFAITTVVMLEVNVTKSDNGKPIICRSMCDGFNDQRTHTIAVPYPPEITFNVTTRDINITEGSDVVIQCSAEGNPTPIVRWLDNNDTEVLSDPTCVADAACLRIDQATKYHSGNYTCTAKSKLSEEVSDYLTVIVLEEERGGEEQEEVEGKEEFPTTVLFIIGGSIAAILLVGVIAVVCVRKNRTKTSHDQSRGRTPVPSEGADDAACYAPVADNDTYAQPLPKTQRPTATVATAVINSQDGDTYSAPLPKSQRANATTTECSQQDGDTYSTPLPKSQRANVTTTESRQQADDNKKEMIYADLDLDNTTPQPQSRKVERKDGDEVEYIAIDFTKKAEPLPPDYGTTEENLYANQP